MAGNQQQDPQCSTSILIHMKPVLRVGNRMTSIVLTVSTFVNVFMGRTHMGFTHVLA